MEKTFNQLVKEHEDFVYTDFNGDTHALGDYECHHEYTPMGDMNLAKWVSCKKCGDIRQRNEVKE